MYEDEDEETEIKINLYKCFEDQFFIYKNLKRDFQIETTASTKKIIWSNKDEEETKHTYIKGVKYSELLKISKINLFEGQELTEIEPAFNCSCTQ